MSSKKRGKDYAIVVHPLYTYGGCERMLKTIIETYPSADIITAWHDRTLTEKHFPDTNIVSSWLQHIPFKESIKKELVLLHHRVYKNFDFSKYKKVIVLSDGFEKHIEVGDKKNLLIVMTPPRFLWMDDEHRSTNKKEALHYKFYKLIQDKLHDRWIEQDRIAAQQYGKVLSISKDVQYRVSKNYMMHSEVLYPPVEVKQIEPNMDAEEREDWYLYLGRVETYKGVELAIRACIAAKRKLKIIGKGDDLARMQKLVDELEASYYVEFLGFVSEAKKLAALQSCRGVIFPVADEDFGIVPVEAQAAGAGVISIRSGGAKETIVEGETGIFFDELEQSKVVEAISRFEAAGISPKACVENSKNFSKSLFQSKLMTYVDGISKR